MSYCCFSLSRKDKQLKIFPGLDLKLNDSVIENKRVCIICLKNKSNTAIIPCGHAYYCLECINIVHRKFKKCPICRCIIESVMIVYI